MIKIYQTKQGKITICCSDKNLSIGLLELNPRNVLLKHNRPVIEELVQVCGSSIIKLFENGKIEKKIILNNGDKIKISANQYHIHSNPTNKESITLWKFEGDITKIIKDIEENNKKIF